MVLSICVYCDVVILYGAVKLLLHVIRQWSRLLVTGAFFILSKNCCNNGQVDVIVAVIAVSIFKNRLDDVTLAIFAVCIFNNGHYDVIIPLLKIDTAIRLTVTVIAVVEPAMTLT